MAKKTWYITGTSRGFGKVWAHAALARGDRVAAAARNVASLGDLVEKYGDAVLPLALDVTDRTASRAAIAKAHEHFGRLDVVINNAGFGHFGFVEELTEAESRAQIETNFFGALWTTQAAIPLLRAQGGGHLVQVSSIGGVAAFPSLGIYHASKWALEGLTEALNAEVAMFGIRTTLIEPGGYATDWSGSSAHRSTALPAYQPIRDAMMARTAGVTQPHADATVPAILALVDSESPPARLLLGSFAQSTALHTYEQRMQVWQSWESVARSADGVATGRARP